jgi:hypothetical protein
MIHDVNKFESDYPENFNWSLLESRKLERVARILQNQCKMDITTTDRIFTPGLRTALNVIKSIDDKGDMLD